MDSYLYSKIALSLLLAGVLGFFIGCWWAWNVFSSWRKRTLETHGLVVTELEDQLADSAKKLSDEKARVMEGRSESEASEAKARATEARLRSMEESTRIQVQQSESELMAARDLLAVVQPKVELLEQREADLAEWRSKHDVLAAELTTEKERLHSGASPEELAEACAERDRWKTLFNEIVPEKEKSISELLTKLAEGSGLDAQLQEAAARQKSLEEQLADHRQTIDTWETHVASLAQEQGSHLETANRTIEELRAELTAVQANLSDRNEAISRLEADAALLFHVRQSMRERQTKIEGLQLQLNQAKDAHHRTEKELADLKQFAASSRDQQAVAREAEISRIQAELDSVRANLADRNESISKLEADAALLSHVRQSMRERQTRIDGLKLQLAKAKQELEDATHPAHPVVAAAPANTNLDAQIEELTMAIAERDRQIQLLEENLLSSNIPAAAVVSDESELNRLRADLADRDERLAAWENRYEATLGELHEEAGRLQSRIREIESGFTRRSTPAPAHVEPAEAAPPAPPAPTADEIQAKLRLVTMRGIQFRPESDEIEPGSLPILENAVEALASLSGMYRIEIAGHTDSWGDDASNLGLSQRRAAAVRQFVLDQGIDGARLEAKGYGGSRPIADNLTADGRYANRRIEFVVRGE